MVLVAAACVAVVAAAVVVTILLPDDLEAVVYRTPLAIGVLIGVTARRALANRPPAAFLSPRCADARRRKSGLYRTGATA